ncbi:hypothetical protein AWY79_13395 [Pseudodesulfovibrio indicus]|nr:hypothetical protein AWY79_13395 [Pseudodesulfovibrio indicus]
MKAKYKTENNEYEASKWHVAEKESQLKLLGRKDGSRFLRDVLWLYKYSSGFGEDPRQAFWVLLMLLVLPLLFLVCIELSNNFVWWGFDHSRIDAVFTEWLKFIPLTRAADKNELGLLYAFMVFWQLLITIQTALFVFALRNNFRR